MSQDSRKRMRHSDPPEYEPESKESKEAERKQAATDEKRRELENTQVHPAWELNNCQDYDKMRTSAAEKAAETGIPQAMLVRHQDGDYMGYAMPSGQWLLRSQMSDAMAAKAYESRWLAEDEEGSVHCESGVEELKFKQFLSEGSCLSQFLSDFGVDIDEGDIDRRIDGWLWRNMKPDGEAEGPLACWYSRKWDILPRVIQCDSCSQHGTVNSHARVDEPNSIAHNKGNQHAQSEVKLIQRLMGTTDLRDVANKARTTEGCNRLQKDGPFMIAVYLHFEDEVISAVGNPCPEMQKAEYHSVTGAMLYRSMTSLRSKWVKKAHAFAMKEEALLLSNDGAVRNAARRRLIQRNNDLTHIGRSVVPHVCSGNIGDEHCEGYHFRD